MKKKIILQVRGTQSTTIRFSRFTDERDITLTHDVLEQRRTRRSQSKYIHSLFGPTAGVAPKSRWIWILLLSSVIVERRVIVLGVPCTRDHISS